MIKSKIISKDSSIKFIHKLHDNKYIESVYFVIDKEGHLCISSMVGCPEKCLFCASGSLGLVRNLTSGEITFEIIEVIEYLQKLVDSAYPIKYVLFQGMGEPLLNLKNVIRAIKLLREKYHFIKGYSISTVGEIEGLSKLLKENVITNLYLSLHSSNDEQRAKIIPSASRNSITDLLGLMKIWSKKLHRKTTLSYMLINNLNDKNEDFSDLIELIIKDKDFFRVQILHYNETHNSILSRSTDSKAYIFKRLLEQAGIEAYIMHSKGCDINGGCGQLTYDFLHKKEFFYIQEYIIS
jgi:23S rRNA (adenine2503-C2)-methyltransferase